MDNFREQMYGVSIYVAVYVCTTWCSGLKKGNLAQRFNQTMNHFKGLFVCVVYPFSTHLFAIYTKVDVCSVIVLCVYNVFHNRCLKGRLYWIMISINDIHFSPLFIKIRNSVNTNPDVI